MHVPYAVLEVDTRRRTQTARTGCPLHVRAAALLALLAVTSLEFNAVVAADVYKSRDAEGRLVFSDHAPAGPAERIKIEPPPPSSAEDQARVEAQQATWQREDAARKERDRAKAQEQAALAAERAKRCSAARSQNATFGYDGRRFHLDPAGNRVYYSAQEIDQKRAEAKRDMAQFCTPEPAR